MFSSCSVLKSHYCGNR